MRYKAWATITDRKSYAEVQKSTTLNGLNGDELTVKLTREGINYDLKTSMSLKNFNARKKYRPISLYLRYVLITYLLTYSLFCSITFLLIFSL